MKTVPFKLAEGHSALRVATAGGREIALDGDSRYQAAAPAEIALLDAHPAVRRAGKPGAET